MTKKCPYCRCENQANFNYCSNCGRSLYRDNSGVYSEKTSNNNKKLIVVSYIITILFSWGGLLLNVLFSGHGYFGFIGIFLPIFLIQSQNPSIKWHGYIQMVISLVGILLSFIIVFNIFN
ncbi:hypothetical protein ALNOE001_08330 [Candidatus Methanobinarius endosymbioticus]|uniref:Zinc-ribbon domain-containing protein n=1 Tax=Candidatus Methanobinarius endosymbioticus TaxID=2006182 RepID=A0A366MBD9_9EURY|nr:hypothetical protein ALNOE001_08330 [Candidatus Methanobinarius endosymbioticus]